MLTNSIFIAEQCKSCCETDSENSREIESRRSSLGLHALTHNIFLAYFLVYYAIGNKFVTVLLKQFFFLLQNRKKKSYRTKNYIFNKRTGNSLRILTKWHLSSCRFLFLGPEMGLLFFSLFKPQPCTRTSGNDHGQNVLFIDHSTPASTLLKF